MCGMDNTQDLIDVAEEVLRTAQCLCDGATVHNLRNAMMPVEFWIIRIRQFGPIIVDEDNSENNIDCKKELLDAINRCREEVRKICTRSLRKIDLT